MGSPPPIILDQAATAAITVAYNQVIFPVCILLSLISSSIMLVWTVRRRRELLVATNSHPWWADAQYSPMRRYFDILVILLAAIQVYMFGVLVAFYPFVWIMPGVKLFGRLDKVGWQYTPGPNHTYNVIGFSNYILVKPGQYLEYNFHALLARELYQLVVRRKSAKERHRALPISLAITVLVAVTKIVVELIEISYPPAKKYRHVSSMIYQGFLFLYIGYHYFAVVWCLRLPAGSQGRAPVIRPIRDRLLALCTFVMIHLAARVVHVGLGICGLASPILFKVFSNCMILLRGFFDAVILSRACDLLCCNWGRPAPGTARKSRRQTDDNRIRLGRSHASTTSARGGGSSQEDNMMSPTSQHCHHIPPSELPHFRPYLVAPLSRELFPISELSCVLLEGWHHHGEGEGEGGETKEDPAWLEMVFKELTDLEAATIMPHSHKRASTLSLNSCSSTSKMETEEEEEEEPYLEAVGPRVARSG